MDLTWPLFIIFLLGLGLWTKRQNTKHIRQMVKDLRENNEG